MNTDSNEDSVIKYNVALLANDSISLEKKKVTEQGHTQ